jgi:hypothetical protein
MIPLFLLAAIAIILFVWAFGPHWLFLCRSSLLGLAMMYVLPLVGTTLAKGLCIGAFDLKGFVARSQLASYSSSLAGL